MTSRYLKKAKNTFIKYKYPLFGLGGSSALCASGIKYILSDDPSIGILSAVFGLILGLKSVEVLINSKEMYDEMKKEIKEWGFSYYRIKFTDKNILKALSEDLNMEKEFEKAIKKYS